MRHTRTVSDGMPVRPLPVPFPLLLQMVNPRGLKSIPLTDIVRVTQKGLTKAVPSHVRQRVESVLREFGFRNQAVAMPVEAFRRMFEEAGKPIERVSPKRERSRPIIRTQETVLRKKLKNLSQERLYITYDDSFKETISAIGEPQSEVEQRPMQLGHRRRASDNAEIRTEGSYVELHYKKEARQKEAELARSGQKARKPSLAAMRYKSESDVRVRSLSTADDHPTSQTSEGNDGNQGL